MELDPAKNLHNVTGFILRNTSAGSTTSFYGNYLEMVWDPSPDMAIYSDLSYNIQILTNTDVLLRNISTSATSHTYTYAQMLADYKSVNGGAPGIFRDYKVRIKVVGTRGQESISWVYINEGL